MHPPSFRVQHALSEWPDCHLEIRCPCGAVAIAPVRLFISDLGDTDFQRLVARLKCRACGARPAPVYLTAGQHRTHCYGGAPDWAVEIVPAPG